MTEHNLRRRVADLIDNATEEYRIEDDGQAIIIDILFYDHDEENGVAIKFTSWDEKREHVWLEEQYKKFKEKIK